MSSAALRAAGSQASGLRRVRQARTPSRHPAGGRRCKIQSHAFVCDLVTIGDDCVISHGVMFINDLFKTGGPAHRNRDLWAATNIGNHVSIGTNSTILPIKICDHVVIGAGSVVTKNIEQPGIYAGNPARLLRRPAG